MATLVLRNIKGSPLSNTEADNNFQYLNNALGANGSTVVPTPSGTGSPVLTNNATLTAPTLSNATLTAPTLSNATLTAPSITSATLVSPALGTPTSGVLTNCTELPASSIIAATGITTWLTTPTSANLLGAITDEVGTGFLTFNNNTTFTGTTTIASLTVNSTVSGTGFTNYFASPPAIGSTSANTGVFTNLSYTGTLTGSTEIINIGSGQIYKNASGNVGIGTTSPTEKLHVYNGLIRVGGSVQGKLLGFSSTNTQTLDFGVSTGTDNGNDIGLYNISVTGIIGLGTNNTERMRITNTGNIGIGTTSPLVKLAINSTDAILIPKGTIGERPTGNAGYFRFNSSLSKFEGHDGSAWNSFGNGGATGGGSDVVFYENSKTITTNYTITSGKCASSTGPITINSGVTVTIPTGSRWVIL